MNNLLKIIMGVILIAISLTDIADSQLFFVKNHFLSMFGRNPDPSQIWLSQLYNIDMEYSNNQQRIKLYQKQINHRNPYAPILLSTITLNMQGIPRHPLAFKKLLNEHKFDTQSINQLKRISDEDKLSQEVVSEAMYLLGNYYYHMKEYNKSKIYLEHAAAYKNLPAMNLLAFVYFRGLGDIKPNMEKTVEWHRKSAEDGYVRSMTNLIGIYEKGYSTSKGNFKPNPAKAAYWREEVAKKKNASGID